MKNLKFHFDKIDFSVQALENLNNEYQGKKTGEVYTKRFHYLHGKIKYHTNKILNYGKGLIDKWDIKTVDDKNIIHQYSIYLPHELTIDQVTRLVMIKTGHSYVYQITIGDTIETGSLIKNSSS
ncbi:MAG: hypothetical protein CL596_05075 [Alteromonas sp.]|nr:hypothetical protein [Alteromonas sp.]|tara:strand:- start:1382 stop:1753 length:372 start_codon:yes stop_codon:yes gene_type:complete